MKSVRQVIRLSRPIRTLRAPETPEDLIVYFIVMFQLAATAALLIGHFTVVVKNQLARAR
jgi:hypothetical protein